jgi:hypothetical protein
MFKKINLVWYTEYFKLERCTLIHVESEKKCKVSGQAAQTQIALRINLSKYSVWLAHFATYTPPILSTFLKSVASKYCTL